MKSKGYVFSAYEQRNKVSLVYLKCKLQHEKYGGCIFKLKCQRTVERTYLENTKQQTRYPWRLYMLKFLRQGNNNVFGLCQQRNQVQCTYLAFRNFKISSKQGQQWSRS